jgi:hypothetical protein
LIASDDESLCSVSRYFMGRYQFVTDSYRLYAAMNRLADRPNIWYNSGPSQKYILRQIKAVDFALVGEENVKTLWQERASYRKDENGKPILPRAMDVGLLMVYGHMLYSGTSYSYALSPLNHRKAKRDVFLITTPRLLLSCVCTRPHQPIDPTFTRPRLHPPCTQATIGESAIPPCVWIFLSFQILRPPKDLCRAKRAPGSRV